MFLGSFEPSSKPNLIIKIQIKPSWAINALSIAGRIWHRRRVITRPVQFLAVAAMGVILLAPKTADSQVTLCPRDPRAARLEKFFAHYNCPEPRHVDEYLHAADVYDLDYRLLPAVSLRETHCGTEAWHNNRWGYHPGVQKFPSVEEGINFVARVLAEYPPYKGKNLHDKLYTYNPLPAYPKEVQWIMRQIE
jgi:hypothetical protein